FYSSKIQDRFELLPNNLINLNQSGLNPGTKTKLITHGFNESPGYCNSTSTIIKGKLCVPITLTQACDTALCLSGQAFVCMVIQVVRVRNPAGRVRF
ncbi:hypothetical protein WDU94_003352, partial [Cyamophila willieti]